MRAPRVSLARARRLTTHVAAVSAFLATTTGGEIAAPFVLAFLGAVALSLWKGDRKLRGLAPLLTVATGGAGLVAFFLVVQGAVDIVLGATLFAAALCVNRLLARASAADDPLLLLTTLLLLAAGAALSGEFTFGLCFAVYGISATLALTFSHLERSADQAGIGAAARDALLSRSLGAALGGLSVGALLGAGLFFFTFPRVNAQWLGRHPGAARSPAVGFGARVELGGIGTLRSDPRPALRVRFPDFEGRPLPSALLDGAQDRLDLLWRGQSLDSFDGRVWSAGRYGSHARKLPGEPHGAYALHAAVNVLPVVESGMLFTPGTAVAVRASRQRDQPWLRSFEVLQLESGDLWSDAPPSSSRSYEVWTAPVELARLRGAGRAYPREVTDIDLQLPKALDPRIAPLARQWTAGKTDPVDQAQAILEHLRRGYRYSTRLEDRGQDPIADFLFAHKEGHCEYFSTAMALLLRTLGVPAREVTGFSGGVRAPGADYFIVRSGDAHSWVELYVPGTGFVSFDPTPPTAAASGASGLAALLAELQDEASERWRKAVVDYDLATQVDALRRAGRALSRAADRFSRDPDAGASGPLHLTPALKLLAALVALLALVALVRHLGRRSPAPADEASLAFAQLQRELARRGLHRAQAETARELGLRLENAKRPEAGPLRHFTELYEQARFAGRPWGPAERARVRALLAELRAVPRR